jgi:hypothetical protein
MKTMRWLARSVSIVLIWASLSIAETEAAANAWKPGRVVSTGLHGGNNPKKNNLNLHSKDVWWSYRISSGDRTFILLSREKPSKTGLIENADIKLSERRSEIIVVNPAGNRVILKIMRKCNGRECP